MKVNNVLKGAGAAVLGVVLTPFNIVAGTRTQFKGYAAAPWATAISPFTFLLYCVIYSIATPYLLAKAAYSDDPNHELKHTYMANSFYVPLFEFFFKKGQTENTFGKSASDLNVLIDAENTSFNFKQPVYWVWFFMSTLMVLMVGATLFGGIANEVGLSFVGWDLAFAPINDLLTLAFDITLGPPRQFVLAAFVAAIGIGWLAGLVAHTFCKGLDTNQLVKDNVTVAFRENIEAPTIHQQLSKLLSLGVGNSDTIILNFSPLDAKRRFEQNIEAELQGMPGKTVSFIVNPNNKVFYRPANGEDIFLATLSIDTSQVFSLTIPSLGEIMQTNTTGLESATPHYRRRKLDLSRKDSDAHIEIGPYASLKDIFGITDDVKALKITFIPTRKNSDNGMYEKVYAMCDGDFANQVVLYKNISGNTIYRPTAHGDYVALGDAKNIFGTLTLTVEKPKTADEQMQADTSYTDAMLCLARSAGENLKFNNILDHVSSKIFGQPKTSPFVLGVRDSQVLPDVTGSQLFMLTPMDVIDSDDQVQFECKMTPNNEIYIEIDGENYFLGTFKLDGKGERILALSPEAPESPAKKLSASQTQHLVRTPGRSSGGFGSVTSGTPDRARQHQQ